MEANHYKYSYLFLIDLMSGVNHQNVRYKREDNWDMKDTDDQRSVEK